MLKVTQIIWLLVTCFLAGPALANNAREMGYVAADTVPNVFQGVS